VLEQKRLGDPRRLGQRPGRRPVEPPLREHATHRPDDRLATLVPGQLPRRFHEALPLWLPCGEFILTNRRNQVCKLFDADGVSTFDRVTLTSIYGAGVKSVGLSRLTAERAG